MSSKAGTGLMVVGAAAVGLVLGVVAMREGLIPGLGAEAAKPAADPTPK